MGARYQTNAASGYNSSPPSDDGSQTAANLITWAKHKTKLTDPVKTLADDINTDLVAAFDYAVRQITTSDALVAGDHMRCVEIAPTATTGCTATLPDAATMTNLYRVYIKNSSAHAQTIARATAGDTIDATAANITLPAKAGVVLQTTTGAGGYLIIARTQVDEEGTFTPTLRGSATAGTQTYSYQVGAYKRVGNVVHFSVNILLTAFDAATAGSLQIAGLPFTSRNTTNMNTPVAVGKWKFNIDAGYTQVVAEVTANSTVVQIGEGGDNVAISNLIAANATNDAQISVAGSYFV